ncbi:hypothetical protein EJ06DRAFT_557222 [Trichodelitschia bisporula]|uniref:Clathrin light chain n=1 Tax=Trichodelitschia bisporula TaxID=703511 RepID=A0A6G1HTY3_9PEZI|nr:hypothetical protein EJ06DRAFT_557222 [Trichodelitschia bisporula]
MSLFHFSNEMASFTGTTPAISSPVQGPPGSENIPPRVLGPRYHPTAISSFPGRHGSDIDDYKMDAISSHPVGPPGSENFPPRIFGTGSIPAPVTSVFGQRGFDNDVTMIDTISSLHNGPPGSENAPPPFIGPRNKPTTIPSILGKRGPDDENNENAPPSPPPGSRVFKPLPNRLFPKHIETDEASCTDSSRPCKRIRDVKFSPHEQAQLEWKLQQAKQREYERVVAEKRAVEEQLPWVKKYKEEQAKREKERAEEDELAAELGKAGVKTWEEKNREAVELWRKINPAYAEKMVKEEGANWLLKTVPDFK